MAKADDLRTFLSERGAHRTTRTWCCSLPEDIRAALETIYDESRGNVSWVAMVDWLRSVGHADATQAKLRLHFTGNPEDHPRVGH